MNITFPSIISSSLQHGVAENWCFYFSLCVCGSYSFGSNPNKMCLMLWRNWPNKDVIQLIFLKRLLTQTCSLKRNQTHGGWKVSGGNAHTRYGSIGLVSKLLKLLAQAWFSLPSAGQSMYLILPVWRYMCMSTCVLGKDMFYKRLITLKLCILQFLMHYQQTLLLLYLGHLFQIYDGFMLNNCFVMVFLKVHV